MKSPLATAVIASTLLFGGTASSLANRDATPEERTSIEQVLKAEGFSSWDQDLEWDDDGYWEVDDAVAADGKKYDVKLGADFAVIDRKAD